MEILRSFRLVLGGKIGKEMPESSGLEFLEKFSMDIFALSDAEDNTSNMLNRGTSYGRFFIENTIRNSPKVPRAQFLEVMDSFVLVAYVSQFCSFKNPFAVITSLFELFFRFRGFILLPQMK